MKPSLTVGEAGDNDLSALAAIWKHSYPGQPVTPNHFDFSTHRYLLALDRGVPAGYLEVRRSKRKGDPEGKVWTYPTIAHTDEDAVMHALYGRLEALPEVHVIFTMTRESRVQRQETLTKLGYQEKLRSFGANLEVSTLELSALGNPETHLGLEGIRIEPLAHLQNDSRYADKLYALYLANHQDVPETGQLDTLTRPKFLAHIYNNDALPEAYHIALHEDRYIGYSELFRHPTKVTWLRQETTAVLAHYRRRGVALALKLRGLSYAQQHGYTHIGTGMASNNTAMVTLNTRLGFVPQEAYITFCKYL